jgi:osmotically-inducible protein OsmY
VRGRGPKGYRRSDERILDEIVQRLMWAGIDAADVEIRVENAEVTLTGTVAERRDKRIIEDACEDVMGVEDVHNQIRVSRRDLEGDTTGVH